VPGTTGGNPGLRGEGLRVEPNSGSEDVDSVVVMAPRVRCAGLCFLGCVLKRRNASSGFFRRARRSLAREHAARRGSVRHVRRRHSVVNGLAGRWPQFRF